MWPDAMFLVVNRSDWDIARKRVLLTRRRLRQREYIRCHAITRVPEIIRNASSDQVLLRIDPWRLETTMGLGWEEVLLYGDLRVTAVDKVYELPLVAVCQFGVPPDCEELYKGQQIMNQVDALPTVPSAEEAEDFIRTVLKAWRRDRTIPAAVVLRGIDDVCSRLSYETIGGRVERQVETWKKEVGLFFPVDQNES